MFTNDSQIEQSGAEWSFEQPTNVTTSSAERAEVDDYQTLLNAAEAARAVLASDEHDYDAIDSDAQ